MVRAADQRVASGLSATQNQCYSYDHDSQLSYASSEGFDYGGTGYSFDANGNVSGTGDTVGDGNAQLSANGYSYTFDAAGNMITQTDASGNVTTYTWDNRNRMASATLKNSSGVTQEVVSYTYDTMNELIGESVAYYYGGTEYGTSTLRFVNDPATGQMQLEFAGGGPLAYRYLWGPLVDQVLAEENVSSLSSPGTVEWLAAEGSVNDAWIAGWENLYAHDQYNAFGAVASETGGTLQFGYDGEYTDPVTGMQYHNDPTTGKPGRWYLPWAERWASEDPTFPLSGPNPDEFCGNSPTNAVDPSGLLFFYHPGAYSIDYTDANGDSHNLEGTSAADFLGALNAIDAVNGVITDAVIKGHGNVSVIEDPNENAYMEVVLPGAFFVRTQTAAGESTNITPLLRRITNSKSQISLRGCFTNGLADHVARLLKNGATVSGNMGPSLGIPGTWGNIGAATDHSYRPNDD